MAKTLKVLRQQLNERREANPRQKDGDEMYDTRHTYCHLIHMGELKGVNYPRFEVRGWRTNKKQDVLEIDVVNWTVCAGTATLVVREENIEKWEILETNPALQVLIGNS